MNSPAETPFQKLLDALLDESTPFNPRYLYRLSDLDDTDQALLEKIWPQIPLWRRQALMEDLEALGEADLLLSFEEVGRLALKDSDPRVRLSAVRTLQEYEKPDLLPVIREMLEGDADAEVRAACAIALSPFIYLGEIEELPTATLRQVEDCLLRVVNGSDAPLVRRRALEALGFSSRAELPPLIETAYNSGDIDWLMTALFAMGRSANKRWDPQVLAMLGHIRPAIRAEAASAAGELEIPDAVPYLLDLLDDDDQDVRMAAIWSLSQIGGEGVRGALEDMLAATDIDEEADLLDAALENLTFNEDFQLYSLMSLPGDVDIDEEYFEDHLLSFSDEDEDDIEDDEDELD